MIWNFDPQVFSFLPLRWYGLMFVLGFIFSAWLLNKILKEQNNPFHEEIVQQFSFYAFIGTLVGARLGHVFFYQWEYYSKNILEIFQPWHGGLASHGGVIGMVIVVLIFIKLYGKKYKLSIWSFLDMLIIPALIVSSLIRFGNFCNSEIMGMQTHSDKGIVFCGDIYNTIHHLKMTDNPEVKVEKIGEAVDGTVPVKCKLIFDEPSEAAAKQVFVNLLHHTENLRFDKPQIEIQTINGKWMYSMEGTGILRHPAQLYESIAYLLLFILSLLCYKKLFRREGLCFSIFLGAIFLFRFFVEFIKIEQVEREKEMALNIGQQLSIPVVLLCLIFAIWRYNKNK